MQYYQCPEGCGCLWKGVGDVFGHKYLADTTQESCSTCEELHIDELVPVMLQPFEKPHTKHPSEPKYMHDFKTKTPELYRCPVDSCQCLWRDNMDGTMSLANEYQKSCDVCEPMPLSGLVKLTFAEPGSRMTEKEQDKPFNITPEMLERAKPSAVQLKEAANAIKAREEMIDKLKQRRINLLKIALHAPTLTGKAAQGQKFDQDKVRMELLPVEAMMGTAKVLTFGAQKYSSRNWEKGIEYSRVYGALMRHITAWWNGEDFDPETGMSHMHHAGCCIAFLQTFVERKQTELDDRPHAESTVDA